MVGPPGMEIGGPEAESDGADNLPETFGVEGVEWEQCYWTTGRVVVFVYFREGKGWVWNDFRDESDGHDTCEGAMRSAAVSMGDDLKL